MIRQVTILSITMLLLAAEYAWSEVQEEPPDGQLYFVQDVLANPASMGALENCLKEFAALLKEHSFPYTISVYRTLDFHYYAFVPIASYADLDKAQALLAEVRQRVGPAAFDSLRVRADRCLQQHAGFIIRHQPDLSYTPETPRHSAEEELFRHWVFCYPAPEKEEEFRGVFAKFRDLYIKTKLPGREHVYVVELGSDQPLFIGEERATTYFDFYGFLEEGFKILGEEGSRLWWKDAMVLLRKIERRDGVFRPDLSYLPAK